MVPIGGVETLNLSGFVFTSATNSFMLLAGRSAFTAKTCGVTTGSQIATKSLNGSYGIGVVEARIDAIGAGGEQDGVAVGLGTRDVAVADVAAGAALVLDEHRAAQHLLHLGRHHAGGDVGGAAGRVRDHDLDRALRIGGECRAHPQKGRRREPRRDRAGRLEHATPRRPAFVPFT